MNPQEAHQIAKVNIVSFGAGQNSTAMIIEMVKRKMPITEIIFSDTGNEMPETYVFLKEFKKWCKEKKLKFTEVQSELGKLKDYYTSKKIIPFRMFRHCTHKFKVIPIDKYIQKTYGKKTIIDMYMGISVEESHRKDKIIGRKPIHYHFPLIDWNIDRNKCVEIIKREGLSIPVKSGCYFCPFQTKKVWIELYKNHKELFENSIDFEKNCKAYPTVTLMGKDKLEDLKKNIKEQKELFLIQDVGVIKCAWCHD